MLKKKQEGSFLNLSDFFEQFSTVIKTLYLPHLSLYTLIFLISCTDHSNVVDPSTDSSIEGWFNVASSSSDAGRSSTPVVTSSDAGTSSTPVVTSSDAGTSSTPVVTSSIAGTSSTTVLASSIAISSSNVIITSSITLSSSIKPNSSSAPVSSSITPSSSSVPVSSSVTPSSSSAIIPNTQQCSYSASGSAGTLSCSEKIYATIVIGSQIWMAENLNYAPVNGASWCYDNMVTNCNTYGRLYNWATAKIACPIGWHLPTDAEWKTLEINQGMTISQADSLYNRGTIGNELKANSVMWNTNNGTNSSGFSALPGGDCSYPTSFYGLGSYGEFWAAPDDGGNTPWYRSLSHDKVTIYRGTSSNLLGKSLRCLKD